MKKIAIFAGLFFVITACAAAQTKVDSGQSVYVADFVIDEQVLSSANNSRQDLLQELKPGILKRIDEQRSAWRREDLVRLLSESLVADLNKKGIAASRVSRIDELGSQGILVQGEFTNMDEGDPLQRAAIGLNKGATKMEVKVMVNTLPLSQSKPAEVLDLQSSSADKGPGGALGLAICGNPYVLAAKFVMAKHTSEKDVRKLASEIADEIQKHMQKQ